MAPAGVAGVANPGAHSGTDELAGLSGTLVIHIDAKGGHSYTFDYHLPSE